MVCIVASTGNFSEIEAVFFEGDCKESVCKLEIRMKYSICTTAITLEAVAFWISYLC
jgi:hypothetical protein